MAEAPHTRDMIPCSNFEALMAIEMETGVRHEMWGAFAHRMEVVLRSRQNDFSPVTYDGNATLVLSDLKTSIPVREFYAQVDL